MISNDELLNDFNQNMTDWFSTTTTQRAENANLYKMRDTHYTKIVSPNDGQYQGKGVLSPENGNGYNPRTYKTPVVINLAAAYIRAITGLQIINGKTIQVCGVDPNFSGDFDIGNDVLQYILEEGNYKSAKTYAIEDCHVRGFGCTNTSLDFTSSSFLGGKPCIQRKFFVAYDLAVRAGNINEEASWCAYADPISKKELKQYLKRSGVDIEKVNPNSIYSSQYMEYCNSEKEHLLDFVHNYYWYDYQTVYDVANPYVEYGDVLREGAIDNAELMNRLGMMSDNLGVDIEANTWTLSKEDFKEVEAFIEYMRDDVGIPIGKFRKSERATKLYQRAEIVGDTVIKKAKSFTQKGHALNFINGFFDESEGYHYGIGRPLAQVQVLLNDAVAIYHSYASKVEIGGNIGITGGGDDLESLIDELRRKTGIASLPDGATISQLGTADAAQALRGLVDFYVSILPMPAGISTEILAQLSTKDMGEGLLSGMLEQMNVSLLHSMNGMESYSRNQGYICLDMARFIAEVGENRVIKAISPMQSEDNYLRFSKQNMAKEYSVRFIERSDSESKKKRDFKDLIEAVGIFGEAKRDAFAPIILENMPIDYQLKEEMKTVIAPQLTPEQQQMQQREQQVAIEMQVMQLEQGKANIRMINAQAMQLEQQSGREQSASELNMRKAAVEVEQAASTIDYNQAKTIKTEADTAAVLAKIGMDEYNMVNDMERNNAPITPSNT